MLDDKEPSLRLIKGDLDRRIVLMGMSCVGKTTFGRFLKTKGHNLFHFDRDFTYSLTPLEGVSRIKNWETIVRKCYPPYVLDNWTTEDVLGRRLAECDPQATIYVLFDTRRNILHRYRVDVVGEDAYKNMYEKMYCRMMFESYKQLVRFIRVDRNQYIEYSTDQYRGFIREHVEDDIEMVYREEDRRWHHV